MVCILNHRTLKFQIDEVHSAYSTRSLFLRVVSKRCLRQPLCHIKKTPQQALISILIPKKEDSISATYIAFPSPS